MNIRPKNSRLWKKDKAGQRHSFWGLCCTWKWMQSCFFHTPNTLAWLFRATLGSTMSLTALSPRQRRRLLSRDNTVVKSKVKSVPCIIKWENVWPVVAAHAHAPVNLLINIGWRSKPLWISLLQTYTADVPFRRKIISDLTTPKILTYYIILNE